MTYRNRKRIRNTGIALLKNIVLMCAALTTIIPFYWMVTTALKLPDDILKMPPDLVPSSITFNHFKDVFSRSTMLPGLFNSSYIAIVSTVGTLFTASLAAFAFAKLKFKGRDKWFGVFVSTMMIPGSVTMIPVYMVFSRIGWVDTHLPLIVPGMLLNAYGVFMIKQFMQTIPDSYIEAAKIDGCHYFKIFYKLMLPLSKPALITLGLFCFIGNWNNYMGALIYLQDERLFTIPLIISTFKDVYGVEWGLIMAATTVSIIPIAVLYFSAQKFFIQGVALTGLKS